MARRMFMVEMETKLKDFDAKMAQLATRPKPKDEKARLEREKTYHFLKAKRDELRDQLKAAAAGPDEEWQKIKASIEKVYKDLACFMDKGCV